MIKNIFSAIGRYFKQTDWLLLLGCTGLSVFSTLLIYSLYQNGEIGRINTVVVQPAMALCGIAAAIVLSKIDYHTMARMWKFHTAVCYGLLLLLFPFGVQRVEWVDDRNWLPIPFLGINFQPSELLKISFIITFAYHLSKVKDTLNRPKQLLLLLLHGLLPVAIIHLQGDDGTALVMAVIFAKGLGLTVGTFVMIYNVLLYIAIGCIFKSWVLPLYSIVTYCVAIKAVDFIVEGLDKAKSAMIVTNQETAISAALSEAFGRGITHIDARGFYSGQEQTIIYFVVNRFQIARLKSIVTSIDPNAFITISDVSDVLGKSVHK